jgi:hypothetical protein
MSSFRLHSAGKGPLPRIGERTRGHQLDPSGPTVSVKPTRKEVPRASVRRFCAIAVRRHSLHHTVHVCHHPAVVDLIRSTPCLLSGRLTVGGQVTCGCRFRTPATGASERQFLPTAYRFAPPSNAWPALRTRSLNGKTGTGKELAARAVHDRRPRVRSSQLQCVRDSTFSKEMELIWSNSPSSRRLPGTCSAWLETCRNGGEPCQPRPARR